MRWNAIAVGTVLVVAAVALRASFGEDSADDAFDSTEVKEIGARADALKLDDEVGLVRRLQRSLDRRLLVPPESAWASYGALRGRTDAGVARILERGRCAGLVTPREGGAYWSFTKRSNSYDKWPQLELSWGSFGTGFYGSNSGFVVKLTETDLIGLQESAVPEHLRLGPDAVCAKARETRRVAPKAEVGAVYAVRAVMWDECDVLAAFEVVAIDAYGATIAWRVLHEYDTPKQKR